MYKNAIMSNLILSFSLVPDKYGVFHECTDPGSAEYLCQSTGDRGFYHQSLIAE